MRPGVLGSARSTEWPDLDNLDAACGPLGRSQSRSDYGGEPLIAPGLIAPVRWTDFRMP